VVLEQVVAHQVDLVLPLTSTPLVFFRLEIVAIFWAIFGVIAHLISSIALKRYVIWCLT
jgi:hypothetical protein